MVASGPFDGLRRLTSAMTPTPGACNAARPSTAGRRGAARAFISSSEDSASRAATSSRTPATMSPRTSRRHDSPVQMPPSGNPVRRWSCSVAIETDRHRSARLPRVAGGGVVAALQRGPERGIGAGTRLLRIGAAPLVARRHPAPGRAVDARPSTPAATTSRAATTDSTGPRRVRHDVRRAGDLRVRRATRRVRPRRARRPASPRRPARPRRARRARRAHRSRGGPSPSSRSPRRRRPARRARAR